MTKAVFDKFLINSTPKATLLYGDSEFLVSHYSHIILDKFKCNYKSMYFEEYNHQDAINYLGANNLFGDFNILVLKLYATLNKKQIQDLFKTLETNRQSFLIIEFYKSPSITDAEYAKRFKAMAMLFKPTNKIQDIIEVRFYQPSIDEMIKILSQKAIKLGLKFDSYLLSILLETQNNDLSIAYGELDKFIYFNEITPKLIQELSYSLGDIKIESLLNILFDKKGNLIEILQVLHDEGIDNMSILREVSRYIYILFQLYGHSKTYGNMDTKEVLGYRPPQQILNTWSRRSIKITTEKYLALFDILNKWRIKQFEGKEVAMQYLIEIQQIL